MTDHVIPSTPSDADYSGEGDRPLIQDAADPVSLFRDWMSEARASEVNDANAMSLATVDADGAPDVRIVLLKEVSADGFSFFTNLESAKGLQLADTPRAALGFHWKSLRRQVRIRGAVSILPPAAVDAYFNSRARLSRISAIASDQSRPLESRDLFVARTRELEARYADTDDIPRPDHWGGFLLVPDSLEFWQDQAYRMHDRLKYVATTKGWTTTRLFP